MSSQVWSTPERYFQLPSAVSGSDDDDYELPTIPKKSKQIATSLRAVTKQEKAPLFAQHRKNKKLPIVNTNPSDDDDAVSIDAGNQQTPSSESLPAWAVIGWKRQFLPLLYTALATARQPFLHYSKGTQELVVTIQVS